MSMTDAEIREALARAERATGGECIVRNRYSHGGGRMYREDGPARDLILDVYDEANREFYFSARTDVPRLAADLLAARTERDLALSLRNTATNVLADVVAHRDSLAARCRELEAERAIVADYLRDTDADFRARRPSDRAVLDALLSPPPPHTCQLHRATSGASDCGLSPCEEATVHRDRGESRPAETATPEAAKCATCGHEERRHLSEDGDGARWCDVALCDCVDYAADEKCKTCGGDGGVSRIEAVGHDEYGDLVGEAVSEPCPDCHDCGGGA